MGAVHTARFKKFAWESDGESNLVGYQQYIRWLKKTRGKVHWGRMSSDTKLRKASEIHGGILAVNEMPGRLQKTNNARRRMGLPTRRRIIEIGWRIVNVKEWE